MKTIPPRHKRPKGLYCHKGKNNKVYFSMKHPESGKHVSLGSDFPIACNVLNRIKAEYRQDKEQELLDRLLNKSTSLSSFIESCYLPDLNSRGLAKNTVSNRTNQIIRIVELFGNKSLKAIKTRDISEHVSSMVADSKEGMALAMRSAWIDIFRIAISSGWLESTHNPAQLTKPVRVPVKRSRITLDEFKVLLKAAKPGLERNVLELAILTSHAGTADMVKLQKPIGGYLHLEREKTKERIKIPLWLSLDCLNLTLADTVERCASPKVNALLWKYWKGERRPAKTDQIYRAFVNVRNRSGLKWVGQPPSLYELRSLSIRLHDEQGMINSSVLAGHKAGATTDVYRDVRGAEWKEVKKL